MGKNTTFHRKKSLLQNSLEFGFQSWRPVNTENALQIWKAALRSDTGVHPCFGIKTWSRGSKSQGCKRETIPQLPFPCQPEARFQVGLTLEWSGAFRALNSGSGGRGSAPPLPLPARSLNKKVSVSRFKNGLCLSSCNFGHYE